MMNIENNKSSEMQEIFACLDRENPSSFFLSAGAGSGKTRALVDTLNYINDSFGNEFEDKGKKVAVITYTNVACEEIQRRSHQNPLNVISTVHSFAWSLIQNYSLDIKYLLSEMLSASIFDLQKDIDKRELEGKTSTKVFITNKQKLQSKQKRLELLSNVKKFRYSPDLSVNFGYDALNHAEVLEITASILSNKPMLQKILIQQYPVILIDECQDTNKFILQALIDTEINNTGKFTIGMFGDTMQKIFAEGVPNLIKVIPNNWVKPKKSINYRSPKRVVKLVNKIREEVDNSTQIANKQSEGLVRIFLVKSDKNQDKLEVEKSIRDQMSGVSNDNKWLESDAVKTLVLEHRMAAVRNGFSNFFSPLYDSETSKDGVVNGNLSEIALFKDQIVPLIEAYKNKDKFNICVIAKNFSPILKNDRDIGIEDLQIANKATLSLFSLLEKKKNPTLRDLLSNIKDSGLFSIPDQLLGLELQAEEDLNPEEEQNNPWDTALDVTLDEFMKYTKYINEESSFSTHQGVKGLEFPRVLVIMDDTEANGFLFSYEKLFGAKELTKTDISNKQLGKDSGVDRTNRLFYVISSRAEESLALVLYSSNITKARALLTRKNWFEDNEIIDFPERSSNSILKS